MQMEKVEISGGDFKKTLGHFSALHSNSDVCLIFKKKKKSTYPLSDALTMYCLSLHALALDRQVMEAVWPNNMALGQIWTHKKRGEPELTIQWWAINEKLLQTQPSPPSPSGIPLAQVSCPRGRSVHHGSRWWWCWSHPSPIQYWCSV